MSALVSYCFLVYVASKQCTEGLGVLQDWVNQNAVLLGLCQGCPPTPVLPLVRALALSQGQQVSEIELGQCQKSRVEE